MKDWFKIPNQSMQYSIQYEQIKKLYDYCTKGRKLCDKIQQLFMTQTRKQKKLTELGRKRNFSKLIKCTCEKIHT